MEYLAKTDFTHLENGRYELDGKKLIAIVMRYKTRQLDQAIWESHRKYIDVQFVANGDERFGYVQLAKAPATTAAYNDENDVILYEPAAEMHEAPLGTFMIFYPDDIHAPSLATGNPPVSKDVVKVVVKVAV